MDRLIRALFSRGASYPLFPAVPCLILAAAAIAGGLPPLLSACLFLAFTRTSGDTETQYFRSLFSDSPIAIEIYDANGRLVDANRACLALFGIPDAGQVRGFALFDDPNIPAEDKEKLRRGETVRYESRFSFDIIREQNLYPTSKTGSIRLDVLITPIRAREEGTAEGYLVQIQDITERKKDEEKIQQQQSFLQNVIESITYPFYVVDVNDYSVKLANSAARTLGAQECLTCYALHQTARPCIASADHPCPIETTKQTRQAVVVEHVHRDSKGDTRYYEVHGHPILGRDGNVVQMAEYLIDITDRKRLEKELRDISIMDELTGLYNRRGFMMLSEKQLAIAQRSQQKLLLIFIDVDNMKRINDTFGHREGDTALRTTNIILRKTFRESDTVARIGGDEFVVLAAESSSAGGAAILERLNRHIDEFNRSSSLPYNLSLSAGVEYFDPLHPVTLAELLDRADRKMYLQKSGKKAAGISLLK